VDAVLASPGPLKRPLIVADPSPLTIPEMIAAVRRGLGRRPGMIPMPGALLRAALRASGRAEISERLQGSLVADPRALMRLGWKPEVTTEAGLAELGRRTTDDGRHRTEKSN
jgi:UDP-glucose 4-epimerase